MIYEWHRSIGGIKSNRALSWLKTMCNFAERWGWRPSGSNPCRLVIYFPEKKRRRYVTDPEAIRIEAELKKLEATRPQAVAFINLLYYTGARVSEIAKAKWSDLDGDIISLPDSKSGYPRTIYLNEPAMEVLERLPRISDTITGIKNPTSAWQVVRTAAGCKDLRLHDLRHNFASDGVSAGLSLTQIGEVLGHKNPSTTMRYAHLIKQKGQAAVEAVGLDSKRRRKGG
jgi:integrase